MDRILNITYTHHLTSYQKHSKKLLIVFNGVLCHVHAYVVTVYFRWSIWIRYQKSCIKSMHGSVTLKYIYTGSWGKAVMYLWVISNALLFYFNLFSIYFLTILEFGVCVCLADLLYTLQYHYIRDIPGTIGVSISRHLQMFITLRRQQSNMQLLTV
jgi:hypothetical protein